LATAAFLLLLAYLEDNMKKIALAVALTALAVTAAHAGGMAAPVMEAPVIVEETAASSAGGLLVPLILLALVAAAIAA
jgi:hypothetical protein